MREHFIHCFGNQLQVRKAVKLTHKPNAQTKLLILIEFWCGIRR